MNEPLTEDKLCIAGDSIVIQYVLQKDVRSAVEGLRESVNTHRAIPKADKVMFNCFIDNWFPVFKEQTDNSSCTNSKKEERE